MAATEGQGLAATENNVNKSHSCNNCGKVEKGRKFKQCSSCTCVRYCSQKCQKEQWKDHKILCQSICELSGAGNQSASGLGDASDPAFFNSHITAKQKGKIARLVGNKCIVKCSLDQEEFEVLWDTGAQVSLISQEMLDERLPYLEVKNISDLLDPSDNLDLLAANGTSIPYKGWTEIDLNIDSHK